MKRKKNITTSTSIPRPLARRFGAGESDAGASSSSKPNGSPDRGDTGGAPTATDVAAALAGCATATAAGFPFGAGAAAWTAGELFALAWNVFLQCLQRIDLFSHSDGMRSTF